MEIGAVFFVATLVRVVFGFGDALVAMPLLALFLDVKSASPLFALVCATLSLAILKDSWRRIDMPGMRRFLLPALLGLPFGLLFLHAGGEKGVKALLAIVLISFSGHRLAGLERREAISPRFAPLAGFLAGFLGGAYNTGGPPIVIYGVLRKWEPHVFRATLQGYFLVTSLFVLLGHAATGLWNRQLLMRYLSLLPVVLLAVPLGNAIHRRISPERFNRAIEAILLLLGGALLWKSLVAPADGG